MKAYRASARRSLQRKATVYTVNSVDRCLRILETLAELGEETRVATLCKRLDLHSSTMVRLLSALMKRGFVEKSEETGLYRLGLKCFQIGLSALNQIDLRKIAYPLLEELSKRAEETVNLTVLQGKEVVCIERIDSPGFINIQLPLGSRLPLYSSAGGKALLAYLEDEQLDRMLREKGLRGFTRNTITDYHALKRELAKIREQGYAVDNEELYYGVRCVAAPIRNHQGRVVGAVSISGTTARITKERISILADLVKETSNRISVRLGYLPERNGLASKA